MSCIIIIQSLPSYDVNKLVFGPFPASFYLSTHFQYSWQKVQIKGANDWESYHGPPVSEATALPTELQTLPKSNDVGIWYLALVEMEYLDYVWLNYCQQQQQHFSKGSLCDTIYRAVTSHSFGSMHPMGCLSFTNEVSEWSKQRNVV